MRSNYYSTSLNMFEVSEDKYPLSFVLGGRVVEIHFNDETPFSPTTTVLQYLRSLPDRKGTKEGCAEGDCGACTVVLGEVGTGKRIQYRSVDSCLLFLPMLHGKQLITVEDLRDSKGRLHAVQTAMVEKNGSQCGYCTPGFMMSLFSLFKTSNHPMREEIDDALTGNLCRCTGYRSIIEAAATACVHNSVDHFNNTESHICELLQSISHRYLHIKTASQEYFKPTSLGEALSLKHQHPDSLVISGATDIALRVTKNYELIRSIIDISDIDELKGVTEDGFAVQIGAGEHLNYILPVMKKNFPALYDMLTVFGSPQIRNMATFGGNLGTASPIGDTVPVLIAYGARVVLESLNGRREIALDKYITGYRATARKGDELITTILLPKVQNGIFVKSYKISKRKDLDIATVSAGFRLVLGKDKNIRGITLAYGGMADHTKRAGSAEEFLLNKSWNRATVEEAMHYIDRDFSPISDVRGSAEFRRLAARNILLKFWSETGGERS